VATPALGPAGTTAGASVTAATPPAKPKAAPAKKAGNAQASCGAGTCSASK
jgi:hypothetical protein